MQNKRWEEKNSFQTFIFKLNSALFSFFFEALFFFLSFFLFFSVQIVLVTFFNGTQKKNYTFGFYFRVLSVNPWTFTVDFLSKDSCFSKEKKFTLERRNWFSLNFKFPWKILTEQNTPKESHPWKSRIHESTERILNLMILISCLFF